MPSAVPIDPDKLIEAAREFANHHVAQGRPKPIWLRRAASSAYYALFHSVVLTSCERLVGSASVEDQLRLTRSFSHQAVSGVCDAIVSGRGLPEHALPLAVSLTGTPIEGVASAFQSLRVQRHQADYDHLATFSKEGVLAAIADAERGIQQLRTAQIRDQEIFASLLSLKSTIR